MRQPKKKQLCVAEIFRQIGLVNAIVSNAATKKSKEEIFDWALAIDYKN